MTVTLNPYLNFDGNAREALEFYHDVFGGSLAVTTFAEMPMPGAEPGPDDANKVMHGMLTGDNDIVLMVADVPPQMTYDPTKNSISLSGDDEAMLRGFWDKLGVGGDETVPLATAPWGDTFGMLTDKFGVPWMVNIVKSQP